MSGWIKFWKDMPNDPRVLQAAEKLAQRSPLPGVPFSVTLGIFRNAVTGALATLWVYADEHIRDDDTLALTSQTLDAVVGIEGFFDLLPREWIVKLDDGSLKLPGYSEKNSLIAKRKRTIKSNARVTRWRRAMKLRSNGVTGVHATQSSTAGDLDQDSDNKKNRTARKPRKDPEWLLDFKLAYPNRAGDKGTGSKLSRAANARIAEGHAPAEFIEGAKRYAAYIAATGKTGTEFVKQAATFLGPDKPFLLSWDPPARTNGLDPAAETVWNELVASGGAKRDERIQHAIEAVGGWLRIQLRTAFDSPLIKREFCAAWVSAGVGSRANGGHT